MKNTKLDRKLLMENLYQYDIAKDIGIEYKDTIETELEKNIYDDILKYIEIVDQTIENNLFNYTLKRLSYVDRAILRIATYELRFTNLPDQIIINEAIEMTKTFSDLDDEKQHKFTNKLLDNIYKNL